MKKIFNYRFEIHCTNSEATDESRVEQMIDLAMQDLVYDDEFIAALGEKEAVTIRVSKLDNRMVDSMGS